jgi:bifunctional ADP-heptose synthase (sugar kinase/adenylyltransferase)
VFNELESTDIISFVNPDILVKGGDYGIDGIVGKDVVLQKGGEVKPLRLTEGISTTLIINRILEMNKKVK